MFTLFKKLFKKQEKQIKDVNNILGDDFDDKVKKMVSEIFAESKERINEDLKKYNIKI